MNSFGEALRDLRSARGLSLRDLGRRVHYSHAYLHDLEQGRKPAATDVAAALDAALDGGGLLVRLASGPVRGYLPDGRVAGQLSGLLRPDVTAVDQLAQVFSRPHRSRGASMDGYAPDS